MLLIANDIDCVQTFRALLALKIDRVSLVQCLETTLLNRREMHKYIFASGALDEAVSLGAIKPFHYTTFSHRYFPSSIIFRMRLWEGCRESGANCESLEQRLLFIQKCGYFKVMQ